MFNAITLYGLDKSKANDFSSKLVNDFNLYFFTFYGDLEIKKRQLIEDIQKLAQLSKNNIAFIDFLETNDFFRKYLYNENEWVKHCPDGVEPETKRIIQNQYERSISRDERKCLENLFYYCLFEERFINPCICFVDTRNGYLVEKLIESTYDSEIIRSISRILKLINERPVNNIFDSPDEIGSLFKPQKKYYRNRRFNNNPMNSNIQISIEKTFAKFIDTIEDALSSLHDAEVEVEICGVQRQCKKKFKKNFRRLPDYIKKKACDCINLLSRDASRLTIEQIKLSATKIFFRMRITKKYRIHFEGSFNEPIFINIGTHRLIENGVPIGN